MERNTIGTMVWHLPSPLRSVFFAQIRHASVHTRMQTSSETFGNITRCRSALRRDFICKRDFIVR